MNNTRKIWKIIFSSHTFLISHFAMGELAARRQIYRWSTFRSIMRDSVSYRWKIMICGCYSSFPEYLPNEKPPNRFFIKLKHENYVKKHDKYALVPLSMCIWSCIWNLLRPFLISWHYPFLKQFKPIFTIFCCCLYKFYLLTTRWNSIWNYFL